MSEKTAGSEEDDSPKKSREAMARIEQALRRLRFGQVVVTVHDGEVVQIDRIERTRL